MMLSVSNQIQMAASSFNSITFTFRPAVLCLSRWNQGRRCYSQKPSKFPRPVRYIPKIRKLEDNTKCPSLQNQVEDSSVNEKACFAAHEREGCSANQASIHFVNHERNSFGKSCDSIEAYEQFASSYPFSNPFSKENNTLSVSNERVSEQRFFERASKSMEAHKQQSSFHGIAKPYTAGDERIDNQLPANALFSPEQQSIPSVAQESVEKGFESLAACEEHFPCYLASTEKNKHDSPCIATTDDKLPETIQFLDEDKLVSDAKECIVGEAYQSMEAHSHHPVSTVRNNHDMGMSCTDNNAITDNKLSTKVYFSDEEDQLVPPFDQHPDEKGSNNKKENSSYLVATVNKTIDSKGLIKTKDRITTEEDFGFKQNALLTRDAPCIDDSFVDDYDEPSHDTFDIFHESDNSEEFQEEGGVNFASEKLPLQPALLSKSRNVESSSSLARLAVKNQALKYLAMRPFTTAELKKKLRRKDLSNELIDLAIHDLQGCGLQSDLAYAETYAQSRWNVRSWGPQRIRQALKSRGVAENNIKIALHQVFKDGDDGNADNTLGISNSAKEKLLNQAMKQWNRGKTVSNDARTQRLIRWLQYRGFDWKVIAYVLKHLPRDTDPQSS